MTSQTDRQRGPGHDEYQHEPLPDAATSIRLLKFDPAEGLDEDIPSFECHSWYVSQTPAYAALSYTWACEWFGTVSKAIRIGGKTYPVGGSCEYALRQVKNQQNLRSTWLWVDSICIDQNNVMEKSKQVAMMGSIYARAAVVYACIGPHADDSEFLVQLCSALMPVGTPTKLQVSPNEDEDELEKYFEEQDSRFYGFLKRNGTRNGGIKSDKEITLMFQSLNRRRYWSRLWIIQEIWLGRLTIVLCGMAAMRMTQLLQSANLLGYHLSLSEGRNNWDSTLLGSLLSMLSRLSPQYIPFNDKTDINEYTDRDNGLWAMISRLKRWSCHDFHDHVYALAGFVVWQDVPLAPNYAISRLDLVLQLLSSNEPQPESLLRAVHDLIEVIGLELRDADVVRLVKTRPISSEIVAKRIRILDEDMTGSLLERPPTDGRLYAGRRSSAEGFGSIDGIDRSNSTQSEVLYGSREMSEWERNHALPEDHFLRLGVTGKFGLITRAEPAKLTAPSTLKIVGSSWFTPLIPDRQMTTPTSIFALDLTFTPEQVVVLTLLDNQYSGFDLDPDFERLALDFVRPLASSVKLRHAYEPEARSFG